MVNQKLKKDNCYFIAWTNGKILCQFIFVVLPITSDFINYEIHKCQLSEYENTWYNTNDMGKISIKKL